MRPVFIVGSERSGTTLLTVLLGRHPRMVATPETHFCYRLSPRRFFATLPRSRLIADLAAMDRFADLECDPREVAAVLRRLPPTPAGCFEALLTHLAERQGKEIVVEKSPHHVFAGDMLLEHFPEARIVHIVRDGRDTVLSIHRTGWSWVGSNLPRYAVTWHRCVAAGLGLEQRHPQRVARVRFEDLVRRPEEELQRLCCFLGVTYQPEMLTAATPSPAVPAWEAKVKAKATTLPDPSRIHAWRETLLPADRWLLNALMAPYLERLHYPEPGLEDCPPLRRCLLNLVLRPLFLLLYSRRAIRLYDVWRR